MPGSPGTSIEAWPSGTISSPSIRWTCSPSGLLTSTTFGWADPRPCVLPPNRSCRNGIGTCPAMAQSSPVDLSPMRNAATTPLRRAPDGRPWRSTPQTSGVSMPSLTSWRCKAVSAKASLCSTSTSDTLRAAIIWSITCGGIAPCSIWSSASSTRFSTSTTGASAISLRRSRRNCLISTSMCRMRPRCCFASSVTGSTWGIAGSRSRRRPSSASAIVSRHSPSRIG